MNKPTPVVSIAMATFNGEKFLEEQLQSILSQTYDNLEVIVCDDASTDNTISILKKSQQQDSRIQIHENRSHLGVVKNFEKAVSLCTGEYIALSDQDDVWLDTKIEEMVHNIKDNLLVHSDASLIDEKGIKFAESYAAFSRKIIYPNSIIDILLNRYLTGCTSMFARKLIDDILPFPDNIYIHDKWISCFAFQSNGIAYISKPLMKYRQHEDNALGAEITEEEDLSKKLPKISKNMRYYRNNPLFKTQMREQLHFITLLSNKLEARIEPKTKKKLDLLKAYFQNASENGIKFRAFLIRLLMFRHFEKNSPFKTRFFHWLKILFM